jgi:hypothetical protein
MPDIFAGTGDGDIFTSNIAGWANARAATTGNLGGSSDTTGDNGVALYKFAGRGATTFRIHRSFFFFDTSGITGTVSEATLKILFQGVRLNDANAIVVKSTAFGGDGSSALAADDFNNLDFSTAYSGEIDTSNLSTYTNITLNATALADIKNNNHFIIAIINYDYDYSNVEPSGGASTNNQVSITFADQSGTSTDPRITYTEATGYSHDIMGLAASSIGKVNTITTANVGKISGT